MARSELINELNEALAKAQASFTPVPKTKTAKVFSKRTNQTFTYAYADLADVLTMALPHLAANGLSIRQPIMRPATGMCLVTELHHSSGQWTSDDGIPLSGFSVPQDFGAELQYARRYGACSMIAVSPSENDDANLSTIAKGRKEDLQAAVTRTERVERATPEVIGDTAYISDDQKARLQKAMKENKRKAAELYEFLNLPIGQPIPAAKFQEVLMWVTAKPNIPSNVLQAFEAIGWTEFERDTFIAHHHRDWPTILTNINAMLDEK